MQIRKIGLAAFVVSLLTFLLYAPTCFFDFLHWDDDWLVVLNTHVHGISKENLRWMFGSFCPIPPAYRPLMWFSFALNFEAGQLAPFVYHLTNVVLHTMNAGLLTLLLAALLRFQFPTTEKGSLTVALASAAGALFWGMNPLRDEVVSWISARGHLLAVFFLMLATLAYLRSAAGDKRWYWPSFILYGLSMLAYPIAYPYFLVLLLIDRYPLRRWAPLEKLPFALLAIMSLAIETLAGAQVPTVGQASPGERVLRGLYVLAYYAWKPWWPTHLSPVNPLFSAPERWKSLAWVMAALLILFTGWIFSKRRQWQGPFTLWVCHFLLYVPFIGLLTTRYYPSDRYSYGPGLVWAFAIAAGLICMIREKPEWRAGLVLGMGFLISASAAKAQQQTAIWKDDVTFFHYILAELKDDLYRLDIYWRLGRVYLERGEEEKGLALLEETLRLSPHYAPALRVRDAYLAQKKT